MAKKQITWTLTDHICRYCGGRVLQSASGVGVTAGGNPLFRCADCGKCTSAMSPTCICWCRFMHRRASDPIYPYLCQRLDAAKDDPALRHALLACGFDPDNPKAEVGIIHVDHYRERLNRQTETEG